MEQAKPNPGALSTPAIFISYRRSDAAGHAGRLHDRLQYWFDDGAVFFDTQTIEPGEAFIERLIKALDLARVILVLIGPHWAQELNSRLLGPNGTDVVRLEVERALQRLSSPDPPCVIPIVIGGAQIPTIRDLSPQLRDSLEPLFGLDMHVMQGKNDDWNRQFVRLREIVAASPGAPTPRFRVPNGMEARPWGPISNSLSWAFCDPDGHLARLRGELNRSGRAAVCGMGGVGKTQLALKYCHEYRDHYSGIWWLRAESQDTLQLDALACCNEVGAVVPASKLPGTCLRDWLDRVSAQTPPWLLVFDNAEQLEDIRGWLPDRGQHHILITSRNRAWRGLAEPVLIDPWTAGNGAAFLQCRIFGDQIDHRQESASLSIALGGLPLALEQAAAFIEESGMAVSDYLEEVRSAKNLPLMLDEGRAATGYERSVLSTLSIAFGRMDEASKSLMLFLSFCAPEPVPEKLFRETRQRLPELLAVTTQDGLAWERCVAILRRYGLVDRIQTVNSNRSAQDLSSAMSALQLHRLTLEIARHRLSVDPVSEATVVLDVLAHAIPDDVEIPQNWRDFSSLVPHVLNLDRLVVGIPINARRLSSALTNVGLYLLNATTLYSAAHRTLTRALELSQDADGAEHPDTLSVKHNLALALFYMGELTAARKLQEEVLLLRRRILGDEDHYTVLSMNNLALTLQDLGEHKASLSLLEEATNISRRVLGVEHPSTLKADHNRANTLRMMGKLKASREIDERVLAIRRRVLGPAHPDTLRSMHNLALAMGSMGDWKGSREVEEEVLATRRTTIGEDHPDTLKSMDNLARTARRLGDKARAAELREQAASIRARVSKLNSPVTQIRGVLEGGTTLTPADSAHANADDHDQALRWMIAERDKLLAQLADVRQVGAVLDEIAADRAKATVDATTDVEIRRRPGSVARPSVMERFRRWLRRTRK